METILYATDCTNNDASSLKYAYRFSCIMNADLHILHVYDFPPIAFSTIQPLESLKKRMHGEQIELVDKYCKTHLKNEFNQKPVITHVIDNNSVSESILRLSKILTPDLIIIGMKDSYSARGYFSGNIVNTLLDTIEIPLLIIPNNLIYNTISTIVYATDFEEADILSIQKLIEIVNVYKTDEYPAKKYMGQFKDTLFQEVSYPEIVFKTIASTNIKSGLLSVLNNEKASMLAMLERKHDWSFSNIFHKDLVKDMEVSLKIPLLAFNKDSTKLQNANAECNNDKEILSFG
ncbi:universal stress protein [Flavivirga rizhaonensis]|uniref:Universal stress protein n=1 Tax=Flavivirga rizhaonensis TaxID=2559571 RepID=A0A4S1E2Y6_9FLAO|nr:universal stress protein [Flavivirga rizhaonensis]TGV04358.1 universal stress protein [Flavivirga rizhaonensis]